jgi:hypothetical protein
MCCGEEVQRCSDGRGGWVAGMEERMERRLCCTIAQTWMPREPFFANTDRLRWTKHKKNLTAS